MEKYSEYEEYFIHIDFPDINDVYVSQTIRLFYPAIMNTFDVVMINDIDLIMIKNSYYSDCIRHAWTTNDFVAGRKKNEHFMGFNFAKPEVWRDVFDVHTLEDVRDRIYAIYNKYRKGDKMDWGVDQKILGEYIGKYVTKRNFNGEPKVKSINVDKYQFVGIKNEMFEIKGCFACNMHKKMTVSAKEFETLNADDKILFYTTSTGRPWDDNVIKYINNNMYV